MTAPEIQERDMEMFRSQATIRGFRLFPLEGKKPLKGTSWQQDCTSDKGFDEENFTNRNAGVCCGPSSGVIVLDVDDVVAFDLLCDISGLALPETFTVRTGGGGLHHYYMYPDDGNRYGCKSLKHPVWSGHTIFDVKGDGGYVVAAGSIHPETGKVYAIEQDAEIAELPKWLIEYISGDSLNLEALWAAPLPQAKSINFIRSLNLNDVTVETILEGKPAGARSEAFWGVLLDLLRKGVHDKKIEFIFEHYPIGEKYRGKGDNRSQWLVDEMKRAKQELFKTNPKRSRTTEPEPETDEIRQGIERLNEEYAVVQLNGKTIIMKEIIEPTFNRPDVHFYSIPDFHNWFANQLVQNPESPKEKISISKIWVKSVDRREYQGIVFSPEKEMPKFYNLWRGFGVQPKSGDWSLMKEHIFDVIASRDQKVYKYLINWMADLVQNPGGIRPGVSIVLRGEQGTGKGCFVTNLGQIVGNHFLHITNQRQLTGRFNQHLKDALLVFVDEGIWAGNREAEGVLKAMITEDVLMIEPKGKNIYTVKNHVRLIFASNNQWVVPAGMGDRRFLVLDVSNAHTGDREWFKSVWAQMNNGGREAMLYDLLKVDRNGVDLRDYPFTDARLDQIINTMTTIEKFWLDRLRDGTLDDYEGWGKPIKTSDLRDMYVEHGHSIGERYLLNDTQFGKNLKCLCPGMERKKQSTGSRTWEYHFPPLNQCRKDFEKKVGQAIEWD
jgi:hypothetical protein